MITAGVPIKILFLVAVSLIWVMILYQIVMTLAGFYHRARSARLTARLLRTGGPLPPVSILVPARNEELVIERTLGALRSLRYPDGALEIIVVDDGSTDATGEIVSQIAEEDSRVRLLRLPKNGQGRGKSHALNTALGHVSHELVAVYDADNCPEPDSLEILARRLLSSDSLGAVLGKFRTVNRDRNLLTRFINLETLGFQWIVQAGRSALFGVGILPGTNFVIRKSVLDALGGWDERAITEDTELSVRIYERGWRIDFAPEAVSWEEEPERFGIWLKQRTRWVRGNFYVMRKFLVSAWRFENKSMALQLLYMSLLYYLFLVSVLVSHLIFAACAVGILRVDVPGPYTLVWVGAVLLFVAELFLVASYEGEHSARTAGFAVMMYLTYCQAWLLVVFRALWHEYVMQQGAVWDKTVRFGTSGPGRDTSQPHADRRGLGRNVTTFLLAGFLSVASFTVAHAGEEPEGDTLVEWVAGKSRFIDSHWGETYNEGIFDTCRDDNFVSFLDIKEGIRVARIEDAQLVLYGKVRPYIDTSQDFWNNKVVFGPGIRLKPFSRFGLIFFAEYLFGAYYGIEGRDPNPYDQTFSGWETGAAFWQRWGTLPHETAISLPFTQWRELYWDVIYHQGDDHNVVGVLQARAGLVSLRWGPISNDFYVRFDVGGDANGNYWNNYVQGALGLRFRPAGLGFDLHLATELVSGHYIDWDGRFELPYDRNYVGFRLEFTIWSGWGH